MNKLNINKDSLQNYWSGKFSLMTGSLFGYYYSNLMEKQMGKGIPNVVLISTRGCSDCYFSKKDRRLFGDHLIKEIVSKRFEVYCNELKTRTDYIVLEMRRLKNKEISNDDFRHFIRLFNDFTGPYVSQRNIVDSATGKVLDKVMGKLTETRLYSEIVYGETEKVFNQFAEQTGKKEGYPKELILCLLHDELEDYLTTGELPDKDVLEQRYNSSALIFKQGKPEILIGKDAENIEKAILGGDEDVIKGNSAYAGHVKGTVRIVFDPEKAGEFNKGDILVTGMTRPDFLPLMEKAGAVVTDAGGILCHAAIVAREMKIPTVIGTEKATKVFKDGDTVLVDAEKGVIRKIKED